MTEFKRQKDLVINERNNCLQNGWKPIPIKNAYLGDKKTGKAPQGNSWEIQARQAQPITYTPTATNTGILCDGMFAIDVDLNDAQCDATALANNIRANMSAVLGAPAIIRKRAGSNRFLAVYRLASGEREQKKIKIENKTTEHAVEILATGQQFVGFGYHYEHGVELEWENGFSPINTEFADIPEISETQIFTFIDVCKDTLEAEYVSRGVRTPLKATNTLMPLQSPTSATSTPHHNGAAWSKQELVYLLNNLPATHAENYDTWMQTGSAIYNTSAVSGYAGFDVFDEWSKQSTSYDAIGVFEKWQDFEKGKATRHSASDLLTHVQSIKPNYQPVVQLPYGYVMNSEGLYFQPDMENDGDEPKKPIFLTSYFEVVGETTDGTGNGTGILIKFKNRDIQMQDVVNRAELYSSSTNDFISRMAGKGMIISLDAGKLLKKFFIQVKAPRFTHTNKAGWHDGSFLLGDGSAFNPVGVASPVIINPANICPALGRYAARGSLEGWKTKVAALAPGNPSLVFHICAAFASPLVELMNVSGGGFHFYGNSRAGKSTALKVAGSVFGKPESTGQIFSWRATDNSLETIAEQMNDQTLLLDEISQCDNPKVIAATAYMLANGAGKGRATQRDIKTFRLLYISNGERTLDNIIDAETPGKIKNAGVAVRQADIPMSELTPHFNLHGYADIKSLMDALPNRIKEYHGTAGRDFLTQLVALRSNDEQALKDCIKNFMDSFTRNALAANSNPQVASIAQRFALVVAAGELAIEMGLLPWEIGEAHRMLKVCFEACISARDAGIGGGEEHKAIELIKEYIQVHDAKFQEIGQQFPPPICHGFKDNNLFYFNATGFKAACAGMDMKYVAKVLFETGFLHKHANERNWARKINQSWSGGGRFYVVSKAILSEE